MTSGAREPADVAGRWFTVLWMALLWLIGGVVDLVSILFNAAGDHRAWQLVGGVVAVIAGLILLGNPFVGTVLVATIEYYLIAIAAIANGVINIVGRLQGISGWAPFCARHCASDHRYLLPAQSVARSAGLHSHVWPCRRCWWSADHRRSGAWPPIAKARCRASLGSRTSATAGGRSVKKTWRSIPSATFHSHNPLSLEGCFDGLSNPRRMISLKRSTRACYRLRSERHRWHEPVLGQQMVPGPLTR